MPKNEATPFYRPGGDITVLAVEALIGKRFVQFVPGGKGTLAHGKTAEAGTRAGGVAGHNVEQDKTGHLRVAGVIPVTADGDIAAGDTIVVGSEGKAKAQSTGGGGAENEGAGGEVVGVATASVADGQDAPVLLK